MPELVPMLPKVKKPLPRSTTATPQEIHDLIANAQPWFRFWLLLCAHSGLRFSEARAVKHSDWNPQAHTIAITEKGGTTRLIPSLDTVEQLLELVPQNARWLSVLEALKGDHVAESTLRGEWSRLKKKLRVNPDLHPHDLRRTLATNWYRQTHDIRAVQQLLGHRNLASTAWYLAPYDLDTLRKLMHELKPITEVKQ